jgi:glutamate/tyrosine decarboxylase-like PLP-dependent enzyme
MPIMCPPLGLSLEELARLAARGELKVHVDAAFPLA